MNNDQFESMLDEFDFSPVTEGLGFNQEKYNKLNKKVQSNIESIKSKKHPGLQAKSETLKSNQIRLTPKEKVIENTPEMSLNIPVIPKKNEIHTTYKAEVEKISFMKKLFSWIMDLVVVSGATAITGIMVTYFITGDVDLNFMKSFDFIVDFFVPMFIMNYLFYFSIFWKTTNQTLGMNILDLKIESTRNDEITFVQTFLRSVMSFVSIFTSGILEILGFSNAISWTKITNK